MEDEPIEDYTFSTIDIAAIASDSGLTTAQVSEQIDASNISASARRRRILLNRLRLKLYQNS